MEKLSAQLNKVTMGSSKYFDAGIISVGTNNIMDKNYDMWGFMEELKNILIKFKSTVETKHVIVIGFMPRAYCAIQNCPANCRYIHKENRNNCNKPTPADFYRRVVKLNRAAYEMIKHDDRFEQFKFLNIFSKIILKGSWDNCYGGFLSPDGLHLSSRGNKLLDECLYDHLSNMIW